VERELERTREYMRAAAEEHEAVQEELRSAHEEMLSANEEFQSTNEELETSKEELQSTNGELTTTIDELRSKNQELARLNTELDAARRASDAARSYADTIIESVREPLAVLDDALRILRANPAFAANLGIQDDTAHADLTAGLLASSEQKDQFIAMLGHELRHPLTPIHTRDLPVAQSPPGSRHRRTARDHRYPVADALAIRERAPGPVASSRALQGSSIRLASSGGRRRCFLDSFAGSNSLTVKPSPRLMSACEAVALRRRFALGRFLSQFVVRAPQFGGPRFESHA
jgi:PAS domain-containing protein